MFIVMPGIVSFHYNKTMRKSHLVCIIMHNIMYSHTYRAFDTPETVDTVFTNLDR